MIPRYEIKELTSIWSEENRYATFLKVELALLQSLEEASRVPSGCSLHIKKAATIKVERIHEIEAEVRHDIIAFCTSITEQVPLEIGRYFHFGATSSDIIDTSMSLMMKSSLEMVLADLRQCLKTLWQMAKTHEHHLTMGRSHGMYAEPMSFGQKILGHYAEFYRRYLDLESFYQNEFTGKISGAVGNYTILTADIEKSTLKKLGLKVEPLSTQIIPRDYMAKLMQLHALLACAIERLSVEFRHLHRSEIQEVVEGRVKGQKGSSTMPHKKNPISFENLTGLARLIKSHAQVALENVVLWHERDISHSSAERLYLPDNFSLMVYMLRRLNSTLQNLQIDHQRMLSLVEGNAHYLSSFFMHKILGEFPHLSREEVYKLVQQSCFQFQTLGEIQNELQKQLGIKLQLEKDLSSLYTRELQAIYQRVEAAYPLSW